jgi:multiple sugar transport system permease protein
LSESKVIGKFWQFVAYAILAVWACVSLFPLYWMISTSLKPQSLVVAAPPQLIPSAITLAHFQALLSSDIWRWTLNSLIVTVGVTVLQLWFSSMAGYAFAKKTFRGKEVLFWIYVGSMVIPIYGLIVPLYRLISALHLFDSYIGLMLPGVAAPFGVFLMRQFIQTLPSELLDSARVDGCSEWSTYWRIIVPLCRPGLAVLGIFVFAEQWSSFFWPLVVTNSEPMSVLTVGVASMQASEVTSGVIDYGLMMAGATWSAVPMIVIFLLFQRHFIKGITLGALKG